MKIIELLIKQKLKYHQKTIKLCYAVYIYNTHLKSSRDSISVNRDLRVKSIFLDSQLFILNKKSVVYAEICKYVVTEKRIITHVMQ
jgi:hypothetical protein